MAAALLSANERSSSARIGPRATRALALVESSRAREVCFTAREFDRRMPYASTSDYDEDDGTTCVSRESLAQQARDQGARRR